MSARMDKRRTVIPLLAVATLVLGLALSMLGGFDQDAAVGESDVNGAMAAMPAEARLTHQRFQQAVALLQHREYEAAVQGFHEVLKVAPNMPEAHVNMGFALLGLGEFEAARSFFDTATNLRPEQTNAYYGLAVAHEGMGDLRLAVAAMRTYTHVADGDDQYRRKAEAAIWEWEAELTAEEQ